MLTRLAIVLLLAKEAPLAAPPVPAAIAAPAGAKLALKLHATGAQIYACAPTPTDASTYKWKLARPDAKLFDAAGAQVGTHGAGPTWTSKDGSAVVGEKVAEADAPSPDAIPWLLVRAKSNSGSGALARVTFIQRLSTKGGKAPATGCDAQAAGKEARVDYSADYVFYTGGGVPK
jgi:hypothetical protein